MGVKVGIIDSGIDDHHANFGGSGVTADHADDDPTVIEPGTFPTRAGQPPGGARRRRAARSGSTSLRKTPIAASVPAGCLSRPGARRLLNSWRWRWARSRSPWTGAWCQAATYGM